MKDISEPYCNWTPDEGAKATPILVFIRLSGIVAICAFAAMPLMGLLSKKYPSIDVSLVFPIAFLACFVSAITHSIAKSKASTSPIRCSGCGQNMKHAQHNYPAKANAGFFGGQSLIEGSDGRQYILYGGGSKSSPRWHRVLQELKTCTKCRRYVVIQKMKLVQIGVNEKDVHEYESRLQRQNRAVAGKKFRIRDK